MQLQRFLQALKNTFSSMSAAQRLEVATFLVPEVFFHPDVENLIEPVISRLKLY